MTVHELEPPAANRTDKRFGSPVKKRMQRIGMRLTGRDRIVVSGDVNRLKSVKAVEQILPFLHDPVQAVSPELEQISDNDQFSLLRINKIEKVAQRVVPSADFEIVPRGTVPDMEITDHKDGAV